MEENKVAYRLEQTVCEGGEQAEERTAREGRADLRERAKGLSSIWHQLYAENCPDGYTCAERTARQAEAIFQELCRISDEIARSFEARPGVSGAVESVTADEKRCSRLASRVEELEKLAIALRDHMNSLWRLGVNHAQFCKWHDGYPCDCSLHGKLSHDHGRLDYDASVAGAHAEEKPRNPNFCRCSHGKQAHEKHGFCDQLRCHCKRFESEG